MVTQNLEEVIEAEGKNAGSSEIKTWLVSYMAKISGIEIDDIDPNLPFERYDLDSSAAVGLTVDLEKWLGRGELDPTLLYDYPTIEILAKHLGESV